MKHKLNTNLDFSEQDIGNPMDGVSNMSDAMLVLAVGIMLALVINWKIDIKDVYEGQNKKENVDEANMQEFDAEKSKEENSISAEDIESNYVKSGTVYTDTSSGKTYVIFD